MRFSSFPPFPLLSILLASALLPSSLSQALPAPKGLWLFDDPSNLKLATLGNNFSLAGGSPAHFATHTDSQENPVTLHGVIRTQPGRDSYFRVNHGIGRNGGGTKTNQYTLVYDVLIPSTGMYRALYQTNTSNTGDASYFVEISENNLGRNDIRYSPRALESNRWHRMAISVDLSSSGRSMKTYVDGELFYTHAAPPTNGEHALDRTTVLFFADDNGENGPLYVGLAAIYGEALDAATIAQLGGPGMSLTPDAQTTAPELLSATAVSSSTETGGKTLVEVTATDADGDRIQAQIDWGDGSAPEASTFFEPGESLTLSHRWSGSGIHVIRARARDVNGASSPWTEVATVTVTGEPDFTFLTPAYLQNMSPTGIVIMAEAAQNTPLVLQYGKDNFAQSVACQASPSGAGTYYLRAVLSGLEPDTAYQYRFASPAGIPIPSLPVQFFHTAPNPQLWRDFQFSQIGDTQGTNHGTWDLDPWEPTKSMLHDMVKREVKFALATGDLAESGGSYSWTKGSYLNRLARILGVHVPYYISWGNHDSDSPNASLRLAADLPSRFRVDSFSAHTPGYGSYAFEYSGVFVVSIDHYIAFTGTHDYNYNPSTNDITNGWLKAQLSSDAAREARFRILMVHVPPYCENWIDGNAGLRNYLVPLLEQYQVDVCLSGHMHGYQRGALNGVNYVVSGGGSWLDFSEPLTSNWPHMFVGGHTTINAKYARQSSYGVLAKPLPLSNNMFNQYTLFTVRDRYLKMECLGFHADGSPMGVVDSFEIGTDPGPDSDGDGLRDAWEIAHGLDPHDPTGIHGADGDPDGDGMTNLQEQIAGTDPRNARSALRVQNSVLTVSGWQITWDSVPGKSYGLETSPDLASWKPLRANGAPVTVKAGPGTSTSHTLPAADASLRKFVRIRALR